MSISSERVPDAEGGGYRRVVGLHSGTAPTKESLIIKAEFGDKLTVAPKNDVITGLMFRTALMMMLKVCTFDS